MRGARAAIRAAIRAALVAGLLAGLVWAAWALPCAAEGVRDLSGTMVTLRPTTRPGAVAEVVLENHDVNDRLDEVTFDLTLDGLSVGVRFDWDAQAGGADAVIVAPPDGYLCVPADCVLTVPERETGTLWIYSLDAVGM